jgi:hypothetical protein
MAIEKVKRASKSLKQKEVEKVEPSPELEQKRQHFQQVAATEKPVQKPKHHSHWKRTLIIAVGALIAVVGTSTAVFAFFWAQTPDRIVMDAVLKASSAKSTTYSGTMLEKGDTEPKISYSGAFSNGLSQIAVKVKTPYGGDLSTVNGKALLDKQDVFIKLDKASQLIDKSAPDSLRPIIKGMIPEIKERADDKWIRMSPGDLDTFKAITNVSQCSVDVLRKITTDESSRSTLVAMYRSAPFLNVTDISSGDAQVGTYRLSINTDQFDAFMQKLNQSEYYKSLAGCYIGTSILKGKNLSGLSVTLTINKAERLITKVSVDTGRTFASTFTVAPVFDVPVKLETPKTFTKFEDIKAEAFKQYIISNLRQLNK